MLTKLSGELTDFFRTRLQRDFPPEELPPLAVLQQGSDAGIYTTLLYHEGGRDDPAAYAVMLEHGRDALLFFFAVEPDHRDQGVGSACMRELYRHYQEARAMIIEVEKPEEAPDEITAALRRRRIRFYERLGYRAEPSIDYLLMDVPFLLMTRTLAGPPYTPEELRQTVLEIYRARPGVKVQAELRA